ncbi:MAG TPA: hypothetical protein VHX12_05010 [Acidisoma sp.]|nr:hypothetical protein [Acidisoma sp.]
MSSPISTSVCPGAESLHGRGRKAARKLPHSRGLNDVRITQANPASLKAELAEFNSGSMGPKIDAAMYFAESTGRRAAIGRLEDADALSRRIAGTFVGGGFAGISFRA